MSLIRFVVCNDAHSETTAVSVSLRYIVRGSTISTVTDEATDELGYGGSRAGSTSSLSEELSVHKQHNHFRQNDLS
jgi:hypothetical protein